jgi:hypothetical protein
MNFCTVYSIWKVAGKGIKYECYQTLANTDKKVTNYRYKYLEEKVFFLLQFL